MSMLKFGFEKNKNIVGFVCYLLLISITVFMGCCCFYGICQSDESLYFAICDRLWKGDKLIVDEWSAVQMYAVLYYPLYSVFRGIFADGTGVFIFFRLFMVFFSFITSLFWQLTFEKINKALSLIGACIIVTFQTGGIEGISYYGTSLIAAIWVVICMEYLLCHPQNLKAKLVSFCWGVSLAAVVLSMPYMIVVIIGIGVYWWIKYRENRYCIFWALFAIGLLAAIVLLKFTNINIELWNRSVPYIMTPPEHGSVLYQFKFTVLTLIDWCKISLIVSTALLVVYILVKVFNKTNRFTKYFPVFAAIVILLTFIYEHSFDGYKITSGYVCYDAAILLLPFIFLIRNERQEEYLLYIVIGLGLILSYALGSNNGYFVCTGGAIIITIILMVYIGGAHFSSKKIKIISHATIIILGILIVTMLSAVRYKYAYRDSYRERLTKQIEYGPGKYIYTTPESKSDIETVCDMILDLNEKYPGRRILFTKLLPWGYVFSNGVCAAPTEWRTDLNSEFLQEYLTINSDNYPEIVVVLNANVGAHMYDFEPNANSLEGPLWEKIISSEWFHVSYPCAEVYVENEYYLD